MIYNFEKTRQACLNINSLLKNIDQLRLIMQNIPVDILAINETKLVRSFGA
jgi:exonuclease III